MKKVVLLAGALATGMAVAPQTANAANPTTPGVDEINALDMSQTEAELTLQKAKTMQGKLKALIDNEKFTDGTVVTSEQKGQIEKAYLYFSHLVEEAEKVCNGDFYCYYFNTSGSDRGEFLINPKNTRTYVVKFLGFVDTPDWIKDYSASLSSSSTIENLYVAMETAFTPALNTVTAALAPYAGGGSTLTPAEIKAKNAASEAAVKATDEYKHLVDVLAEAKGILDGTDPLYSDKIYENLMDEDFDAHLKDGAMISANNLLDKIEGAGDIDTELVSEYELMVDLDIVTPELEGLISTFKKHANKVAADALQKVVDDKNIDGENGIIAGLQHHLDTKPTCFDAANHVITEDAGVKGAKQDLEDALKALDPDAIWNALGHDAAVKDNDRALNEPIAVEEWYKHQHGATSDIDTKLTNYETAVYTACLTYDSEDIKAALDELDGADYREKLMDGETTKGHVAVGSDLKAWLHTHLEDYGVAGTLAEDWFNLDDDFTNNLFMGDISATEFATAEAKVDALEKAIANLKANWADIESLNNDVLDLKLDMANAKENNGYYAIVIKDKWENATTGELKHYNALLKKVEDAIDAIDDTEATETAKAGNWAGADSFADDITLESNHHAWLADYQKINYDAYIALKAAIDARDAEFTSVKDFTITSNDAKNPDTNGFYTTDTNKGKKLSEIKGEKATSENIYMTKTFAEIIEHLGDNNSTLSGSADVSAHGDDLKYDLINKWYNDAKAEYKSETYVADWAGKTAAGAKVTNTTDGVKEVLTLTAETSTEKVLFGWLQAEIQDAFKTAIENEMANKDLHDKYQEVKKYVADGQNLINDGAKIVFGAEDVPACDIEVYDMATRLSSDVHRDAINWNVYMTHVGSFKGNVLGFPTPIQWNLSGELDSEKYLEEGWTTATPVDVVSYNPVFDCHHEKDVWGWNKIQNVMKDLEDLEKKEYDKVASLALLNGTTKKDLDGDGVNETFEETLAEVKENVDDITNEAYTQLYINGLAYVQQTLNLAKGWAKALDGICHTEDALKPCSDDDMKNNPCGWDEADAKAKLQAIINEWNAEYKLVTDTDHKGTEDAPEVNDTAEKCAAFKAYVIKALNDIREWENLFAKADKEHKVKLNAALDLAGEEAHALHHYSYNANQALINYNDAEKAAVNLWAVDFSKRKIGTFNGEEVTFQQFVNKIDDKMIAEGAVNHTLYPDVYAAIKKFAEEPIANFQDYIDATEKLEVFIKAVAQVYCDYHQYTELKKLADGTKNFNWDADFQKAVDANNAAHVELLKQLAQAQATLDAAKNDVIADKNEVYPVDYTTLTTTDLKEAQDVLDAQKTNIEKAWKDGKAADYSANGNEDGVLEVKGYALDLTKDGKNVIDAYVAKAQAAKDLYAANKVAKEELLVQIQAILTNTNSAYEEVECAETAGCTQDFRTDLDNLKKALVGEDGNGGIKKEVNDGFAAKFAAKTAAELKDEVDALETKLGQVKKDIAEFNHKVLASADAKADILDKIEKAFGTEGSLMKPALAETGAENFKHVPATGEVRNTAKYFDEINAEIDDLKTTITNDDSHAGNHSALEKYNTYLQTLNGIKADLEELVQAIKDNEQAHKDQLKHRDELYKKYECYDTTGLDAAVNDITDPDFTGDTEFPVVPGYPETAVDPAENDHTKAHTAVAEAIKALDAEIEKHYKNGASNVEAAKTKIGEKETEYTTAFQHAQTNDSKFMEEYGKCTEAATAVKYTYENWKADHFENGTNMYSDEADVQVTNAYNEMVKAQKAYLKDIKTDWYNNEVAEKVANNEGLLNTYKEKINAYNAAVEKAQTNDQEFDKQLAAHVVKPLTAEATYTDTRVVADPTYVTLKAQLTALYPECNNVETDSKYNTIRKQIIQDWEDEKSALNGTAEAVAAYQAAAKKYNELMANLNAYGSQLVKYFQQSDAFDAAKTTIAYYDIMKPGYKDFDGNTEGAEDYNHKKDIENAISNIDGKLNTLYGDMKTEATHVAETINDADLTNNEGNDLYVDPAVGTIKTLIENLVENAKAWEDACDANEAAFEPLHDNIKAVEADYAPESAKVTALHEPAQEAFNIAVKENLEALAELQKDLEEAYMAETAAEFTKDNTDYEDLKKEIEEMYARAVQADDKLGDIDGINGVTVYDSDALVDIVLYNRGYDVKGDFDFNGENDVTDVERLNNLLWYEHILKAWAPGRVAFEGDIELTAEGNTVALALNNNVQTNGIQFDVTVPEGAYIDNVLGTDRVEGMRVLTACIADNTYRVLVISTLNASTINDNEGAIVTFNVCGGNEVEVSNVIATDGNSHRLNGAAVSVGITTEIDEIATEGETDIFSLDGIRQSVMKAGVNIVRGANGVAKKIFNK